MQRRCIGKTGLTVSRIGLGTVKLGRNQGVKYPAPFILPTDDEIKNLLAVANDLGINLLDTAPAYGSSEERLGKLISDRHQWVITTKVGEEFVSGQSSFDFSSSALNHSIERSLQRLRTDYLDIVLVHSNGDDERIIHEQDVFSTLEKCRQAGKIRAYGMSTKTIAGALLTLKHADIAMITFNPDYTDERAVISHAEQIQKSIFIKKAIGSGHLTAANALPFVLAESGVTSVIVGTINPHHLRSNALHAIAL